MTTCGNKFYPSYIEDHIYEVMEDHLMGFDLYDSDLIEDLEPYFKDLHEHTGLEYVIHQSPYPICEDGGTVEIAWIESGHLHMVGWAYKDRWSTYDDDDYKGGLPL